MPSADLAISKVIEAFDRNNISLAESRALQLILDNRTALERFELEQAARRAVGAEWDPVCWLPGDNAPWRDAFGVVMVGHGWRPEVISG